MFLGVDHGTTAIRFATAEGKGTQILRKEASLLKPNQVIALIRDLLEGDEPELIALSYSMGDGLSAVTPMGSASNRGLLHIDGAGIPIGGGTRIYEAMEASPWPVILLPGIHRHTPGIDPRLRVFSHGASPEKVGLAYRVVCAGSTNAIVCDASSNTVTLAIFQGRIIGAIDAPIFAPGLLQGPLDVEAIREVDQEALTANMAFSRGGILYKMGLPSLEEASDDDRHLALETLALFAAMEISALRVLLADKGTESPDLFLAGDPANRIHNRVSTLLRETVEVLPAMAAAQGGAEIARDVFHGAVEILGLPVEPLVEGILQ